MAKSQSAFRTISEVATTLDTPTHVLRFWESKFSQIKPVKRAGGRRYYRPEDIQLLAGIKTLLHDQGMTIKGAQKMLREQGVKHVIDLAEGTEPSAVIAAPTPEVAALVTSEPAPIVADAPAAVIAEIIPEAIVEAVVETPAPAPRPQILAALVTAKPATLRKNAAAIAPHLTQLAALRDRIRQSL